MYNIINSTTWKYCPIAFTWIVHVHYKNMASYCKNHAICIFQKQSKGPRCHHKPLLTEQNRNWRPDNGNIKANLITTRELPNSDRDPFENGSKVFPHFATKPKGFCFEQSHNYLYL